MKSFFQSLAENEVLILKFTGVVLFYVWCFLFRRRCEREKVVSTVAPPRKEGIPTQLFLEGFDEGRKKSVDEIAADPDTLHAMRRLSAHCCAATVCQHLYFKARGLEAMDYFVSNPEQWYFEHAGYLSTEARELFTGAVRRAKLHPTIRQANQVNENLYAIKLASAG